MPGKGKIKEKQKAFFGQETLVPCRKQTAFAINWGGKPAYNSPGRRKCTKKKTPELWGSQQPESPLAVEVLSNRGLGHGKSDRP